MKHMLAALAVVTAVAWAQPPTAAAAPSVNVTVAPPATLQVGDPMQVKASAPAGGERYLLTLTVVDLETGNNVDLEGWISTSAGQPVSGSADQATATWNGKAGKPGRYRVYVTAVPLDHPDVVSSSAPSELTVNLAPSAFAGPLVAVSVGEPLAVTLGIGWILWRRRRGA